MTTTRDTAGVIARSVADIIMFGGSHASHHAHSGPGMHAAERACVCAYRAQLVNGYSKQGLRLGG